MRPHLGQWCLARRSGLQAMGAAVCGMLLLLPAPSRALDLLQSYQAALDNDATLRAARAAATAGAERLPQARALLYPNVGLSAGRNFNDLDRTQEVFGQLADTSERFYSHNQTLTLRQPLYRRPLALGVDQAQRAVDDTQATLEQEQLNLRVRLTSAYMEALLAQDQLDLVLTQRKTLLTLLDAARKGLQAGSGTRTDIDDAQARLDMNSAQELEARQHLDFTRRQLEVMVQRPVEPLARLDPLRLPLLPPDPPQVGDWIALAEASNPELRAWNARREMARIEVQKAQSAHLPTLDAIAQISRSASENVTAPRSSYTNRLLGLQLNLPLYAGGQVQSVVRQAMAEHLRAEEQWEATRRELGVRVHREHRGVSEGVLRVRALEQAVRSAEQLVLSSQRSYQAGARTLIDTMNAEQQKQLALRDLAQARYGYLLSRVRLESLVGGTSLSSLEQINGWLAPAQ
ncbi:TolC family outer membrane protein [Hydrogenophaga sp. OTU3427]|uniref:TolC family outer membrane protein n=1 Tax=Hydrogenophaga sp. OTU3427 TaxID=3043856 RepID=UPI00313ECB4B